MKTYYCKTCQKTVTFELKDLVKKCSCGYIFENKVNRAHQINMRSKWSGTTQIEFSETTMEQSMKSLGLR